MGLRGYFPPGPQRGWCFTIIRPEATLPIPALDRSNLASEIGTGLISPGPVGNHLKAGSDSPSCPHSSTDPGRGIPSPEVSSGSDIPALIGSGQERGDTFVTDPQKRAGAQEARGPA